MDDKSTRTTTDELWMRLFEAPNIERFLDEQDKDCTLPSLPVYLEALCSERGIEQAEVVRAADIERSFGSRIFTGTRRPSRDTVLQLAFGLRLSANEAQQLLKVAREAPLHPKVKRDAVIAYALHRQLSLMEAQQSLYDLGLPLLGGRRNG